MTVQLLWYRTDLRVQDNRALQNALSLVPECGAVVAVYIATPQQWQAHDDAPVKLDFWRRCLRELEKKLGALKIPLLYLQVPAYADIADAFKVLFSKMKISAVHFNREYPLNELQRDDSIECLCREKQVFCYPRHDRLLTEPGSVMTQAGQPFKVFTPYSRRACSMMGSFRFRKPVAQDRLPRLPVTQTLALEDLSWPDPGKQQREKWQRLWPAGENAALDQLKVFCEQHIDSYRQTRDFPALEGTSKLSPHLAAGTVSARQCWAATFINGDGTGMETWRNELLWRDFYHYVMFHFPHVCRKQNWRSDLESISWRKDDEGFNAWCKGRTGIPLVDAAMRQLLETGWMHNRLRMVTAMFLSKNLLVDWRRGEQWFMRHLVDGDFAANNGGWQWSASTGTDASPYFRVFNPVSQSLKFDQEGEFIRRYVPELKSLGNKAIHNPEEDRPGDYPEPVVELKSSRQRAIDAFRNR